MKVRFKHRGDFKNTRQFLKNVKDLDLTYLLQKYGEIGVQRLREFTPKDSGKTADSWYYEVTVDNKSKSSKVEWFNSNIPDTGYTFGEKGAHIALLLQYGHATGTGGYVQGIDYINPALSEVFDQLAEEAWKEVKGHV